VNLPRAVRAQLTHETYSLTGGLNAQLIAAEIAVLMTIRVVDQKWLPREIQYRQAQQIPLLSIFWRTWIQDSGRMPHLD
jgi:hypothetical protein